MKTSIIVAMDERRGIGKKNALMWKIPGELARFKQITMGRPIIMGRKTYESIGRVLPGRTNIIVTRNKQPIRRAQGEQAISGALVVHSLEEAIKVAKETEETKGTQEPKEVFVIGGGQIFEQALPFADRIYLTLVKGDFGADTFFPDHSEFKKIVSKEDKEDGGYSYSFLTLEREKLSHSY